MQLTKCHHANIPLWIKLHNVPLQFWNEEGLRYIASVVGKPLYVDSLTIKKLRISYAGVCVEVHVEEQLLAAFDLRIDVNGQPNIVEI